MKKFTLSQLLIPVLIVVILILISYVLIENNTSKNTEEIKVTEPTLNAEVEKPVTKLIDQSFISVRTYKEPDKYAVFNVSYPQFQNVPGEFNKRIYDLIMEGINDHKKDSEDNWKARYETRSSEDKITEFPNKDEKFSFDVSWEPTQVNDKFISFILTVSGYTGGAHGYENLTSFNYDVVGKKEIVLADLFSFDSNYLKTISEFSRKDLEVQFRKSLNIKTKEDEVNFKDSVMPMLLEGTTPTVENFSIFTFTTNSITFYFAQYQVGPYAMGEPKVTMPRK